MPFEVGSRLGHYKVTALIGEGGICEVYRATDDDPQQPRVNASTRTRMLATSALSLAVMVASSLSAQPLREDLRIDLAATTLSVAAWGEGTPVILLPGLGVSVRGFEVLAPRIAAEGFRVLAVNPRGIGGSTGPLTNLTLHDYADDLAGLVTQMDTGPVHLVGWAWGNRVARCVAADHPHLVATVTLLAAGGKVPPDADVNAAFLRLREPDLSQAKFLEAMRIALLAPTSDPLPLLDRDETWPEGGRAAFAASRATPLDDWWSGGTAPMLVVQGEYDRLAPAGNGHALRDEHPDRVTLVEIADAGHLMVLEQPGAVATAVVQFLKEYR